jgi:UDP-N-acetylglucosamine 2-epimerase
MKLIYLVAGARPNFMKIAPIVRALCDHPRLQFKIIHTGQHYDREMNEVFFEELGIPLPDAFLHAGGGSHAEQTAKVMLVRDNTERPVTIDEGSNVLDGTDPVRIVAEGRKVLRGEGRQGRRPYLWDGQAAQRSGAILDRELAGQHQERAS